jgi:hypothetical protein
MFDVSLFDSLPRFNLASIVKSRETLTESELNVLMIANPISAKSHHSDFNQILDAIIRTLSLQQVNLFER